MKVLKEIAGSELLTLTEVLFWAKHCTSFFCFLLQTALWNVISNDKKTETQMISNEKLPRVPRLREDDGSVVRMQSPQPLCSVVTEGGRGGESRRWAAVTVCGEPVCRRTALRGGLLLPLLFQALAPQYWSVFTSLSFSLVLFHFLFFFSYQVLTVSSLGR